MTMIRLDHSSVERLVLNEPVNKYKVRGTAECDDGSMIPVVCHLSLDKVTPLSLSDDAISDS